MDTIQRLNELLESNNTTLYTVAKETGLHFGTLKKAMQRHSQLSVGTIEKICHYLNMELFEFFMNDNDWALLREYFQARTKS